MENFDFTIEDLIEEIDRERKHEIVLDTDWIYNYIDDLKEKAQEDLDNSLEMINSDIMDNELTLCKLEIDLILMDDKDKIMTNEGFIETATQFFEFLKKSIINIVQKIIEFVKNIAKKIISLFRGKEVVVVKRELINGRSIEKVIYKRTNFLSGKFSKEEFDLAMNQKEFENKVIHGINIDKIPNQMKPDLIGKLKDSSEKIQNLFKKLKENVDIDQLNDLVNNMKDLSQNLNIDEIIDTKHTSTIKEICFNIGIDIGSIESTIYDLKEIHNIMKHSGSSLINDLNSEIKKLESEEDIEAYNNCYKELKKLIQILFMNITSINKILFYVDSKMVDYDKVREILLKENECLFERFGKTVYITRKGNYPRSTRLIIDPKYGSLKGLYDSITDENKDAAFIQSIDMEEFANMLQVSVQEATSIIYKMKDFDTDCVIVGFSEKYIKESENDADYIKNILAHEIGHIRLNHSRNNTEAKLKEREANRMSELEPKDFEKEGRWFKGNKKFLQDTTDYTPEQIERETEKEGRLVNPLRKGL
jgi:hypothetical protein